MVAEQPHDITARQRGRADRSGKGASSAMYGKGTEPEQQVVKHTTPNPRKDNYKNPSEFYAGPTKAGKIHGVRRNESADKDTVAFLLTDEGLMTGDPNAPPTRSGRFSHRHGGGYGGAAGGKSSKVAPAERENLNHACAPTVDEPAWRPGVKMTHCSGGMDAPYFEEMDPKPAREVPPPSGRRHLKPFPHKNNNFIIDPTKPMTAEEIDNYPSMSHKTNKANESVNVLCLNRYTPAQLNEPPQPKIHLGPRKWTAPDMPPKPKPHFANTKSRAKDEHDVLGTGRWGTAEVPRPEGVGKGACRPKHDTANLFGGDPRQMRRRSWVPPNEVHPLTAQQRKRAGQPNLLKYYDPGLDGAMAQPAQKPHGNRSNEESKGEAAAYRAGRAPGAFSKNGHSTNKSLW